MRTVLTAIFLSAGLLLIGCKTYDTVRTPAADSHTPAPDMPLPDRAFKAQITLAEPLTKMTPGEKKSINVKVKNVSDVLWIVYGTEGLKYRVAVGDSWLDSKGQLVTNMDGRYGLPTNLSPGSEAEVPLLITAPMKPGDYTLQLDLVQ